MSKRRIVVGPYRLCRKYADSMGWNDEQYVIVSRAHQLATMDPAIIGSVITLKLHSLGARIATEITSEICRIRLLWSFPVTAAA